MRPQGMSVQELEVRRRVGMKLLDQGLSQRQVAKALRCSQGSVSRWAAMVKKHGEDGLCAKPGRHGGAKKLTEAQEQQVVAWLLQPANEGQVWTCGRLAQRIASEWDISVHETTVLRLLRRRGYTPQKPNRRCKRQDPQAEAAFRQERWPAIKKKPRTKGARSS